MDKKNKRATKEKVASKKTYKGIVIKEFSVGYISGIVKYSIGDVFTTENLSSLNHLINTQKIKK